MSENARLRGTLGEYAHSRAVICVRSPQISPKDSHADLAWEMQNRHNRHV